jgi:vitamin B12 transporter
MHAHLLLLSLLVPALWADEEPSAVDGEAGAEREPEPEVFLVEEPRVQVRALPGATITSIDVSSDAARVLDLGDLLSAAPGVRVRSAGGSGAPQLVQLRGAGGGELRVMVDGVPLPQDASGAVDLSSLPLESVERIEVYRGTLPLGLGGEGVAGAINLITREPRGLGELRLTGGLGSFHSYEGSAGLDAGLGAWVGGLSLAGASARNDFPYLDDNGTPYTSADDDPDAIRRNADNQRAELSLRARRAEASWGTVALSGGAVLRETGVPGPGSYQVGDARLAERRAQLELRHEGGELLERGLGASANLGWQRYRDPQGEVGLGLQDQRATTIALALDGLLAWEPHQAFGLALAGRLEDQSLLADNALDDIDAAERRRDRASTTLEASGDWRTLGYGLRGALDWARSSADGGLPLAMGTVDPGEATLLASPSAGISWRPVPWLGLRSAGGLAHRLPSFPELYGDAGTVVGNEALRPERGITVDLGADLAVEGERALLLLSLTGYDRELRDLIAYVQNSQYTLRAENFERVRVAGLELEGGLELSLADDRALELGLAYSANRSTCLASYAGVWGAELPGLPGHEGFADLTLELGGYALGVSTELQSASYRDTANLQRIPGRALIHVRASARPWRRGPRVILELRNALDHRSEWSGLTDLDTGGPAVQAVSDFLGYPLPGRAAYLSAEWSWAP